MDIHLLVQMLESIVENVFAFFAVIRGKINQNIFSLLQKGFQNFFGHFFNCIFSALLNKPS